MSHIAMSQRPEDVRDNIVKIVDSKGNFHGTGFVIEIKQDIASPAITVFVD